MEVPPSTQPALKRHIAVEKSLPQLRKQEVSQRVKGVPLHEIDAAGDGWYPKLTPYPAARSDRSEFPPAVLPSANGDVKDPKLPRNSSRSAPSSSPAKNAVAAMPNL